MSHTQKNKSYFLTITTEAQADLYLQLSRLEEAGFPALQAIELLLKTNQKLKKQILQFQRFVKLGHTIADSGYRAGVFSPFDKNLLQAAEASGNMGTIYKQLAKHYEQKVKRAKKIKSKCYLPFIILTIALFVQPLPAFILNEINLLDYASLSFGRLIKVVLLVYITFKLPFWLTHGKGQFLGLKNLVYLLQLKLPLVSTWIIKRQLNVFFRHLGLLLAAGLPMIDALPKAVNTMTNPGLRAQFNSVILTIQKGEALADALVNVPVLDYQTIQIVMAAEKSGKLAKTILHQVKIEQEEIDLKEDLLTEWIPRIFNLLVSLWVAASIITGNSIATGVSI